MTYDQQVSFRQNSDSGENNDASIQPIVGEPATPENASRPLQHLRRRTERIRAVAETLLYLADYDKAFVIRSNAKFALAVSSGNHTLSMVAGTEDDLWIYPALTPGRLSGGRNKGGRVYVGALPYSGVLLTNDLAFTLNSDYVGQRGYADGTTFDGGGGNPAITLGANGVTLTLAANTGAAPGVIAATITGDPKRKITITYGTSGGATTIDQIITWVNNPTNFFTGLNYGPAVFFRASRDAGTPGTAAPTAFADAPVLGAYDAEAHQVTVAQLAAFFAVSDNRLKEGEGLAIAYVPGPVESGGSVPRGGRRQSLWDLPTDRSGTKSQNTTPSVGYSLFNTGREPEKIPCSVPIGKLIGDEFVFIDGTRVSVGSSARLGESHTVWDTLAAVTSPTGASLLGYGGSGAYHVDAAGATRPALPSGTLEATLDGLVGDLANDATGQSGALRIGMEAITGVPSSENSNAPLVLQGSIRQAFYTLLGHGTSINGVAYRVHENGHTMKGLAPLRKNYAGAGMPAEGAVFLQAEHRSPTNLIRPVATAATGVVSYDFVSLQPLVWNNAADANDNLGATETIVSNVPLGTDAVQLSGMTNLRYAAVSTRFAAHTDTYGNGATPIMVVKLAGVTGAASASNGYYLIRNIDDATKSLQLVSMVDHSAPDFTGMAGGATISFYNSLILGNDKNNTRIKMYHFGGLGAAAPVVLGVGDATKPLIDVVRHTVSGADPGFLIARYCGDHAEWYKLVGGGKKSTKDILDHDDYLLLDGVESGTPVDATAGHHHGGAYTQQYWLSTPSVHAGFALNSPPAGEAISGTVPAGYTPVAVMLKVEVVGVVAGATANDALVACQLNFFGSASGSSYNGGSIYNEISYRGNNPSFTGMITVPLYFATAAWRFRVTGSSTAYDVAGTTITLTEVGFVLRKT